MKSRFGNEQVLFSITHGWDENSIKYDANGNIQALRRDTSIQGSLNTGTPIDELKYTYSASIPYQLTSVYDTTGLAAGFRAGTGTYTYDANGNLTYDPYKGIAKITYDVLNRTDTIKISSTQYITYTYNAGGSLLRKEAYKSGATTQITDYLGGWVYTGTSGSETLSYCPMPEGRLLYSGGVFVQQYIITDPQGNARVSFQNNGSGVAVVKQENSYYGYGLIMPGTLVSPPGAPANKQLYNGGSEWQNDYSTLPDYYQSYNRNYDAALARWVGVDPMAEGSASMSVYHYSGDNPIMMNDPDGNKSAAPGSQYVDYDNSLQGSFQGHSDLSGGGGGLDPLVVWEELEIGSGPDILASGKSSDANFINRFVENVGTYLVAGALAAANSMNYTFNASGQLVDVRRNGLGYDTFTQQTVTDLGTVTDPNTGFNWYENVLIDEVAIIAAQAAALGLTGSDNSNSAANQGGESGANGDGFTLTTITSDVTIPQITQINGPFFHSSERFYTGTVAGKEGENNTTNATKDLKGGGLDKSYKILGVSFGYGVDSEGFNLSFGFSNSTYTLGASEEGITYGGSMLNGTNLIGHTTTFTPSH